MMRPASKAPSLNFETINGEKWSLSEASPKKFTMVIFYRGLHCPLCKKQLESINEEIKELNDLGVSEVVAVSGDTKERAEKAHSDWEIDNLQIGYGLDVEQMTDWGLFISKSIKSLEPELFNEPGLFLIDSSQCLFYCSTNSMPFARPGIEDLIFGLKQIKDGYPRRGTVSYDDAIEFSKNGDKHLVNWRSEIEMADNHMVTQPRKEKENPSLKN
jgi:peroxiredoxin